MATQAEILAKITESLKTFNKSLPAAQKRAMQGIMDELRRLDTSNGKVKTTVANLRVINSIRNKIYGLILTDDYKKDVKTFAGVFNEVRKMQNEYFSKIESRFKPKTLLKEVTKQAMIDTVNKLTEGGVGTTIADQVTDVLRTNITAGGSYRELEDHLRGMFTDTDESYGIVNKYARQITSDALHQYNRQYIDTVSGDLGFEWYSYQGTDIKTTRPFCDACTDFMYFHVSQIPDLLKAKGLYYVDQKTNKRKKVALNPKTGLPYGMYPNTNPANFLIYLGGYNCRHIAGPVSEKLVKIQNPELFNQVVASNAYKLWKKAQGEKPTEKVPTKAEVKAEEKQKQQTKQTKPPKQSAPPPPKNKEQKKAQDTAQAKRITDAEIKQAENATDIKDVQNAMLADAIDQWLKSPFQMRTLPPDSPEKIAFTKAMKTQTKYDTLYRGISFNKARKVSEKEFKSFERIYKPGAVIKGDEAIKVRSTAFDEDMTVRHDFVSYSTKRDEARIFAKMDKDGSSPGYRSIFMTLKASPGRNVHGFDLTKISEKEESEVVVGGNYKYEVISAEKNAAGNLFVTLQQIV